MSARGLPTPETVDRDTLRALNERLTRLERRPGVYGTIIIGGPEGVEISVVPTGGGSVNVHLRNIVTGATSDIVL